MRIFNKKSKRYIKKGALGALLFIFVWGVISILPLWRMFRPGWLFQRHLVVIMNEAEARPCGGFITAYGVIEPWKLSGEMNNSYTMAGQSFGVSPDIMNDFVPELSFWDLSTETNTTICREIIKDAYEKASKKTIGKVHFVNIEGILPIIKAIGTIEYNDEIISEKNFFSMLSRTVANTDRHDERSLAERKGPLAEIAKKLIKKAILSPWKWPQINYQVNKSILSNTIDVEKISPEINGEKNSFGIIEWNLGGAKSSRYLKKELTISYKENRNNDWDIFVAVHLHHTGQSDAPLSQDWKGVIEVLFPEFLQNENEEIQLELKPGDTYQKQFKFTHKDTLPQNKITVFQPRMGDTFVNISLSAYPQQSIRSEDFEILKEYTAIHREPPPYGRNEWNWTLANDKTKPFITIHEFIPNRGLSYKYPELAFTDIVAEIHLNEEIKIQEDEFYAELLDRNYTNQTHQNMIMTSYVLLPDNQTLLIGLTNKQPQPEERYFLQIEGIQDKWGNPLQQGKRTLIDRVNTK